MVSEIVFEELVIPLLLIPIYVAVFLSRRREFNRLLNEIEGAKTGEVLLELETEVNKAVKSRAIKVYHGLVLRNAIEETEGRFGGDHLRKNKRPQTPNHQRVNGLRNNRDGHGGQRACFDDSRPEGNGGQQP